MEEFCVINVPHYNKTG